MVWIHFRTKEMPTRLSNLPASSAIISGELSRKVAYPSIDGLRFWAALLVFCCHLSGSIAHEFLRIPATDMVWDSQSLRARLLYCLNGLDGVDLFFVISGFLMGRIVLRQTLHFSYLKFVIKRVIRIYPAFLASLIINTAYLCSAHEWIFSYTRFLGNLLFLNAVPSYFSVKAYNHVTWSLGYEFAFYLIVPIAAVLARLTSPRLSVAALLLVATYTLYGSEGTRMLALFAGLFISAASDSTLTKIASKIPLLPVAALYICFLLRPAIGLGTLSYYPLFVLALSGLFIKVGFGTNALSRLAAAAPIRALGTLSYSFYLYHTIAITVVLYQVVIPNMAWMQNAGVGILLLIFGSSALSLISAAISYFLFEAFYFRGSKHVTSRFDEVQGKTAQTNCS